MEACGWMGGRRTFVFILAVCFVLVPSGQVLSLNILFLISSVYRKELAPGDRVGNNNRNAKNLRASSARIVGD